MSSSTSSSSAKTTTPIVKSDDIICKKYDRFLSNAIMSTGVGLLAGSIASLILFKRRSWPIHWGIGMGFGYALKDLELQLNATK